MAIEIIKPFEMLSLRVRASDDACRQACQQLVEVMNTIAYHLGGVSIVANTLLKLDALAHPANDRERRSIAAAVVGNSGESGSRSTEIDALSRALGERLREMSMDLRLRSELAFKEGGDPLREREGMLWLDARAADFLEDVGPYGRGLAAELRTRARVRWEQQLRNRSDPVREGASPISLFRLWYDPDHDPTQIPFVSILARVLWRDEVEPRLRQAKVPALSITVLESSHRALWSRDRHVEVREEGHVVANQRGEVLAVLRATGACPVVPGEIASALSTTRSLIAHRLVRLLVKAGYEQFYVSRLRDYRKIVILGGYSALAHQLGLSGSKGEDQLRRALGALQHIHIHLPHGDLGGLLTWSYYPEAPTRRAVLSVVLGDALLPNYVVALSKRTAKARESRMLVPIPSHLPPMVGMRRNEYPAQATLQLLILAELRRNAATLVREGSVRITDKRRRELAIDAELPGSLLHRVIERWLVTRDDGEAFLVSPEADRYSLAEPAYRRELLTIVEAGKKEINGRAIYEHRRHRRS